MAREYCETCFIMLPIDGTAVAELGYVKGKLFHRDWCRRCYKKSSKDAQSRMPGQKTRQGSNLTITQEMILMAAKKSKSKTPILDALLAELQALLKKGNGKAAAADEDDEDESEEEDEDESPKKPSRTRSKKAKDEDEEEDDESEDDDDDADESEEEDESEDDDDDAEDSDDDESEEDESEDDDEEEAVTFAQVKNLIDKYGEKNAKKMKAILASFKVDSTAVLKKSKKKWAPIKAKILATFKK